MAIARPRGSPPTGPPAARLLQATLTASWKSWTQIWPTAALSAARCPLPHRHAGLRHRWGHRWKRGGCCCDITGNQVGMHACLCLPTQIWRYRMHMCENAHILDLGATWAIPAHGCPTEITLETKPSLHEMVKPFWLSFCNHLHFSRKK